MFGPAAERKGLLDSDIFYFQMEQKGLRPEIHVIEIKGTPAGPAPEEYRKLWNGAAFAAVRVPEEVGNKQYNPITGEISPDPCEFLINFGSAMDFLSRHRGEAGKRAIEWFRENFLARGCDMLSFSKKEVEVISIFQPNF